MPIPGNLLSSTTEAVDPNTSGWLAALNCTKSLGSGGRNGPGTLMLTSSAAGEMQARTASTYPIVPGEAYYTFADASSGTQPERIGIRWLAAGGAEVGVTWSMTTSASSTTWHRISVAGVAPDTAATAQVILSATAGAAGRQHHFENVYLGLPMRTTGNLLGFNTESGGELDTSGWIAEANTTLGRMVPPVTWGVDWYYSGGHVLTATAVAAGDASIAVAEPALAEPGREYLGWAYLNPPTSTADCWIELRWYDAAKTPIGSVRSVLDQPGTGWYRQRVSGVAPAGTARVGLAVGITGATAGQMLRTEGVVLQHAPALIAGTVVPYEDASFEQGLGAWTVQSGTGVLGRSVWDASAPDGTYWATLTSAAAGATTIRSGRYPLGPGTDGQGWRQRIHAYAQAGTWQLALGVRWLDEAGALIDTEGSTASSVPGTSSWWIFSLDLEPPPAASQVELELTGTSAGAGVLRLDRAALWPSLPLTAVAADADLGRVTLTLRELTVGQLITVWRVTGGQRALVRGPDGLLERAPITSDLMVIEDYEAPLGVPVRYAVETYHASTGAVAGSRTSGTVTLPPPGGVGGECWLTDPANPQRNATVLPQRGPDWSRPIEQGEHRVRGRRNPVVISDVRGGRVGDLAIWTRSDEERERLHWLLDSGNPLLWRTPPGYGIDRIYVSVGDAVEGRVADFGREAWRAWTLPLTEIDPPTGGVNGSAGRTWADVLAEHATWQHVLDTYGTWEAVLLHQPEGGG